MVGWITPPLTVHLKFVFEAAGWQHDDFFPHTVGSLPHGMSFDIPLVEIPCQPDLSGAGFFEREGDASSTFGCLNHDEISLSIRL
jgi:hypothetical protein